MYTEFYGLEEKPFALVPDPRFLYLGSSHREALAHLLYGIEEGEGFIEVVGQVGTGKTTLCRTLLDRLGHDVDVSFIFNPSRSELELLTSINREFGLPTAGKSRAELAQELNEFLIKGKAAGRRMILVIDEAQNLAPPLLEQVRLLSNMETEREKLLQIVLIGQPELEENLAKSELRQLRQRITVRWDLRPFDRAETGEYLGHRLRVAGRRNARALFTPAALRVMYRATQGTPRLINAIADRALLAGYAANKERIDASCVRGAAKELSVRVHRSSKLWRAGAIAAGSAVLTLSGVAGAWHYGLLGQQPLQRRVEPEVAPASLALGSRLLAPLSATAEGANLLSLTPRVVQRGLRGTAADALAQVLYLWGYTQAIPDQVDPNDMAAAIREVAPLKLLVRQAPLEQLAKLNLPVILEIEPEPGKLRYVTLQRLTADGGAVLVAVDRSFVLRANDLQRFWKGRTFVLWMNHRNVPTNLEPGQSDAAVRWVQQALTKLGYLRPGDPSGSYDRITEDALRNLQRQFDLEVTGRVTPETLIAMYAKLDEKYAYRVPRLVDLPERSRVEGALDRVE